MCVCVCAWGGVGWGGEEKPSDLEARDIEARFKPTGFYMAPAQTGAE